MSVSKLLLSDKHTTTKSYSIWQKVVSPISRGIMLILIEAEAMPVDLSNSEDAVMVGPTIRITMECISISITHMTHNQSSMVLPAVYVADLTIPPITAAKVNMT